MSSVERAKAPSDTNEPPAKRPKPSDDDTAAETGEVEADLQQQVLKLVESNKHVVILDVRTVEEVLRDGFIKLSEGNEKDHRWLNVSCTAQEGPLLEAAATNMIPDKSTPIIVHCKSGRRAGKAKSILEQKGYTSVVNAGGFTDLDYLQKALE